MSSAPCRWAIAASAAMSVTTMVGLAIVSMYRIRVGCRGQGRLDRGVVGGVDERDAHPEPGEDVQ